MKRSDSVRDEIPGKHFLDAIVVRLKPAVSQGLSNFILWHADALAAKAFENGEKVGNGKKIPDLFVEVDGAQFAALVSSGEIQAYERAEARAVHAGDVTQIEDQAAFGRHPALHFVLQETGILINEIAATLHDGGFRSDGDGQDQPGI